MNLSGEEAKVQKVLDSYAVALERGDAELWESLFWLDDPNFTAIENDRPHVLDRKYIEWIAALLRQRGPRPGNQRWYDTRVFLLTPEVACTVSLREELDVKKTSRVTLVFQKKGDQWRIVHGHFSCVPEQ